MADLDEQGRPVPPSAGDEASTILGFLEFQRATFEWKCAGLDAEGLSARLPPSTMTLGGMMKHLALVEEWWFSERLAGEERSAPWNAIDWDADPDWEWRTAAADPPEELRELWRSSVATSRRLVDEALAQGGLDQLAMRAGTDGQRPSLRWIACHMVEEYARHVGHADLLRESIDGSTGE